MSLTEYTFANSVTLPLQSTLPGAELPAAVVIGGANVDFKSQTLGRPISGTSNPGHSRTSLGGVGRNVAENLARLGVSTALITAVGDDANGDRLLSETQAAGVDTRYALTTPKPTGTYTAILNDDGEMVIAVAAMDGIDQITPHAIDSRMGLITHARILVLDCNVAVDALLRAATIARNSGVAVVVDPVSVVKAGRLVAMLDAGLPLHTIKPNIGELRALTGAPESADIDLRAAATQLHSRGVLHVWVTLGMDGSFLSSIKDGNQRSEHIAACEATVIDATGAGDAMLAGYAAAVLMGLDASDAARYGRAAAALTVESEHTVNPSITFAALTTRVALCAKPASPQTKGLTE